LSSDQYFTGFPLKIWYRNPTVEEQALARIHRFGQKKEITTIRFFMRGTLEEV
jgi:SNF2 family DNA or RNA helicase